MTTTIEAARRVKRKAAAAARSQAVVVGVGLTRVGDSYVVKVNLRDAAPACAKLPDSIDGVAIVYEVVGVVRSCAGAH